MEEGLSKGKKAMQFFVKYLGISEKKDVSTDVDFTSRHQSN